jgi:hypothetical protein
VGELDCAPAVDVKEVADGGGELELQLEGGCCCCEELPEGGEGFWKVETEGLVVVVVAMVVLDDSDWVEEISLVVVLA